MSMDGAWLYVTNNASSSLSVIDLARTMVTQTVLLPSRPEGVEVGLDGRVLISMVGTGLVSGVPQGTLATFDPRQTEGQQLTLVSVPALPSTPAPLPPLTLPRPVTTFRGKLMRTPDGQFIVGVITPTNATTYIFVYEVASGVILRNRTASGQSSVLSMAPDGSRFMAGLAMYDTATLAVTAQMSNASAPFQTSAVFNTLQNVGGSVFAPDGGTLYSAFNTASGNTLPAPPPLSSTLLVSDPNNLGIRLGIKLPESIVAKMVMTADAAGAWGMSESGLLYLPLGKLYEYPILMPETNTVFLAMDQCNRGIAKATLKVNNLGGGKLTFSVPNTGSALIAQVSSGLAPAEITFTMEPGRTGIQRRAGTNIWTGAGTASGNVFLVTLASADAVNVPPVIRVYMNYRQPDQRGIIVAAPTMPNNNPANSAQASGNEGLQDLLLDEQRQRLYITNSGLNRVEVFDTARQRFLDPIPVGQFPHSMALATDGTTLYVGNTGGESISIVDLDLGRVVGNVDFPPIPRNGTVSPIYPRTLAMGYFGLQFVMSDGSLWKLVGNQAIPRPASSVIAGLNNGTSRLAGGPAFSMAPSLDNEYIVTLAGNGMAFLYDSKLDQYTAGRYLFSTNPIQGYYGVLGAGPGGNYFLANGLILNSSLTVIGGSERPGTTTTTTTVPGQAPVQVVVNTGNRHVAAVAPITDKIFLRLTTPVRQAVTSITSDDERTTLEAVDLATGTEALAAVAPENPVVTLLGTSRVNTQPRMMVVDSKGVAYAITLSGLSVIPLTVPGSDTRPQVLANRGIVNSNDGTQNIRPGSFITVAGRNLAAAARADSIPAPTLLGGSCVTFGDISIPLLQTSSGQILAQVPGDIRPGVNIVQVRSLATAQASDPVAVTVQRPSTTPPVRPGTVEPEPAPEEKPPAEPGP
jgi:YVTN family beta-propeller protein